MQLAELFGKPILTMIDTPGAYPGVGAEERGQAEAIARNLKSMITLRTPIVTTVIGEGGSGGALAIGVGDRILDARVLDLLRHLSRRMCGDSLEGWGERKDRCRIVETDSPGPV